MTTEMPDSKLLSRYARLKDSAAQIRDEIGHLEQEIYRRLEERKALAIPDDEYLCELKLTYTYDQSRFTPLKEMLVQADLATCWFPQHPETIQVPERWNTVKVLALARRYGQAALDIVEQARMLGGRSLVFRVKKG